MALKTAASQSRRFSKPDITEGFLIQLTRLNEVVFFLNPHQIEYMEANPDTTLVMLSGKRIVVKESIDEVRKRIVEYRRLIGAFKNEE